MIQHWLNWLIWNSAFIFFMFFFSDCWKVLVWSSSRLSWSHIVPFNSSYLIFVFWDFVTFNWRRRRVFRKLNIIHKVCKACFNLFSYFDFFFFNSCLVDNIIRNLVHIICKTMSWLYFDFISCLLENSRRWYFNSRSNNRLWNWNKNTKFLYFSFKLFTGKQHQKLFTVNWSSWKFSLKVYKRSNKTLFLFNKLFPISKISLFFQTFINSNSNFI